MVMVLTVAGQATAAYSGVTAVPKAAVEVENKSESPAEEEAQVLQSMASSPPQALGPKDHVRGDLKQQQTAARDF